MSLREKSNAEISNLLTDYCIKHGPVLRSTRSLYERKLEEAMAKDRTYYREEEEEITDITYYHPKRRKTSANSIASSRISQRSSSEPPKDQQPDQVTEILPSSIDEGRGAEDKQQDQVNLALVKVRHRTTYHNEVEIGRPISWRSEGKMWMVVPAVLLLTALTLSIYCTLSL